MNSVPCSQAITFEDKEVEPKASYAYRVRAIGVADIPRRQQPKAETPEEGAEARAAMHAPGGRPTEVRRKKIEVIRPVGVEEVELDGTAAWITPFSEEESAETPTNVELVLKGIMGDDPDWRARIKIRQWNRKIDDWDEGVFNVEEEEPIRGSRYIRYESGQKKVKFDSGYVLVRLERVAEEIEKTTYDVVPDGEGGTKKIERTVKNEVEIPQATVKEVATGKVEVLRPPTEREEAAAERETQRIKHVAPRVPAGGGRRRRRTEDE